MVLPIHIPGELPAFLSPKERRQEICIRVIDRLKNCTTAEELEEMVPELLSNDDGKTRDQCLGSWVAEYCLRGFESLNLSLAETVINSINNPLIKSSSERRWHLANNDPEKAQQHLEGADQEVVAMEFFKFRHMEIVERLLLKIPPLQRVRIGDAIVQFYLEQGNFNGAERIARLTGSLRIEEEVSKAWRER